jgi:Tol biopolymer transport system component
MQRARAVAGGRQEGRVADVDARAGTDRSWIRAWLVVGLAAWAQVGVDIISRAQQQGLVEDIAFSPYHVVGYAALLTLAIYVLWAVARSLRRGGWRRALPPLYGGLGLALLLGVGWVVLDGVWRSTLGISDGIEGGIAPPRLLIPAVLVLIAAGPLREAIATRARPGIAPGELRLRWAGVVATGLIGGALTIVAFNPVRDTLNDLAVNSGADRTEIWTMNADGSGQTRVLQAVGDGNDYSLPTWSSDGRRIAYTLWSNFDRAARNVRYEDQMAEIWTMAADGTDRKPLVGKSPDQLWIPAWSPDRQWIAYTLTPHAAPNTVAAPQAGIGPVGQVGPPVGSAGASIWVVHANGADDHRLTAEGVDALGLAWSPDGSRVAFSVSAGGDTTDIHVATFANGAIADERPVAADPANDWAPAWSPDGTKIAFTSNRSGIDSTWIAAADGSSLDEFRVQTDPGPTGFSDWVPAWSPDGTHIAFVSDRTGDPEIWSAAIDGSELRNLTDHPQHYDGQWSIAWSPDGSKIAYATGSYGDAGSSGWVREDLAAAEAILFGIALAVIALLLVALGAPFGSATLALTIVVALAAIPGDGWRFLPGAIIAGLIADILIRSVRLRVRPWVAATALPALANLAIGLTIGWGGTMEWSITLLFGVTVLSAVLGWGLAEATERLFPRPVVPVAAEALKG